MKIIIMSINKTGKKKFNKKIFASSNSLDNNIHIRSLSPKSISSNLIINNNNCIQNNINITNKIKIQPKHNKSNSNYNINFNNLFFYGANTPSNYIDYIGNNIKNNQNVNLKNINTNFYMLNFNNLGNNSIDYNSRNKNVFNNSNIQKEIMLKNNSNYNNAYRSFNNKIILNKNKTPIFTLYKNSKNRNLSRGKTKEKIKNIKLELNDKYKRNF